MESNHEGTIAQLYQKGWAERETYLDRARSAAKLTIPTLIRDSGDNFSTNYKTPFQSVGARGVNNLASKLLFALLPPNSPFFRLTIDDFDLEQLIGTDQRGPVEEGFAKIERAAMQEIEAQAYRVPVFEALKHLIVSGNCLIYMPEEGGMRVFHLDRFVVKRDPMGNVKYIITKEDISKSALTKEQKMAIGLQEEDPGAPSGNPYELYTYVCNKGSYWHVHQEIGNTPVPDSYGKYKPDLVPFIPLRFSRVDGESYGRGFVEEYIGDLKSLEALSAAIVEGSAAAAKVLFMVRPNGTTRVKTLAESPNGAIVQGDANDVSTLQLQKYNDFRVALETTSLITERLSFAFLLNSSVQRNAERVTAEEIRFMAQELETALGGVYSVLSQEFQLPLVTLLLQKLVKQKKMPKFPKESVKPQIVTGVEALGRGQDLNKLSQFIEFTYRLGPDVLMNELNVSDLLDRLGASLGIDTGGLVKSQEQKMQEQQQAMMAQQQQQQDAMIQNVVQGAVPNAVSGMTKMAEQNPEMVQQMTQEMLAQLQQ